MTDFSSSELYDNLHSNFKNSIFFHFLIILEPILYKNSEICLSILVTFNQCKTKFFPQNFKCPGSYAGVAWG